jgi:glutathione peroxidase-family protein
MMKTLSGTMKYLRMVSVCILLLAFMPPPKSIYGIQLKDIDGTKIELVKYRGKKMVFIILSGREKDSAFNEMSAFCARYKDSTAIFGVLSIEDGYTNANKESIKSEFNSKCPGLTLTEGMYVRKASAEQSELMQWFSHADQNMFLNNDITGTGWKFFVGETGDLYAGLGEHALLISPFIQRVMNRPVRKPRPAPAHAPAPGAPHN